MAEGSTMKVWRLGAVLFLAGMAVACGGNSTAIAVIVTAPGVAAGSTATIITNGTMQFSATVTGASATTVYWQICLPASAAQYQPTNCTAIPNVTPANAKALTGYGTITQTGLYTAPPTPPSPNKFVIMAISTISPSINEMTPNVNAYFGILNAAVDSGVRVQVFPTTATIGAGETLSFNASVSGTTNTGVTWAVNGIVGGNLTDGTISTSGVYSAPSAATSVTITATSGADPSQSGTAALTVSSAGDATLTSIDPTIAAEGSAQQDIYLNGSNFFSNDTVVLVAPGQSPVTVVPTFISTSLLRATIPGGVLSQAGQVQVETQRQNNGSLNAPGPATLSVVPVRPALIASSPDSVSQTTGTASVILAGGFFTPKTSVQFNGPATSITPTINSSRQMTLGLPDGVSGSPGLGMPGLYPITVQNPDVPSGQPSMAALNLAVTPDPSLIPTGPVANVPVGANPSALAIDYAAGTAIVANTGSNNVSIIDLSSQSVLANISVGQGPTGVAVDDMLAPPVALVVNSVDQTVSTINLTTDTVISTTSVAIGPSAGSPAGPSPVPYSIGVNPLTHRAVVAYESFNEATIVDVSTGQPTIVQQVGGDLTAPLGTGTSPGVAIDERLNWAIVTPGGGGAQTTNIVDLGHNASAADPERDPQVIASLAQASFGVGINQETHQSLLTNPNAGNLGLFSLLDNKVNSITFTSNGTALNQLGFIASAVDSLENIGVAVNVDGTARIVDLEKGTVLQTVTGLGTLPQAVAVDPASNQAVVVNQGSNDVSILSLGPAINPLQIVEASPAVTFTSSAPLTLTLTGVGLGSGDQVLLDGAPLTASVSSSRQLTATVPASMLGSARQYALQVQDPSGPVSNVSYLTVVQPIIVGNSPTGVAVDTDRDMAVVTNSGDGTVSLVALSPTTPVGISQTQAGAVGTVGAPISVGTTPLGVAVIPRLGFAVVANNEGNNVSLVDLTQTYGPQTLETCSTGGSCTGPTGVAVNQDTAQAVVTNTGILNDTAAPSSISFATVTPSTTSTVPSLSASSIDTNVDQNPIAVAVDPSPIATNPGLSYLAVGTSTQSSSVQVVDSTTLLTQRLTGFQNPSGIVFDALNKVFLVADSLQNSVDIIDPLSLISTPIRVGINPTALDYDFQTGTLVTSNFVSHTLSVLDYACPPPASGGSSVCLNPQVRAVLGLGGSPQFSVAIDPKLNLAVVTDQANNRVLLIPLPR
jgi:YVTN family beta-propeller protein